MLPISLDRQFVIVPLVFSNVYKTNINHYKSPQMFKNINPVLPCVCNFKLLQYRLSFLKGFSSIDYIPISC
jgi:hypothetical protein